MAEPTLNLTTGALKSEIGYFLGFGRDSNAWDAEQTATVKSVLESGLRQVYHPPVVGPLTKPHEWSFLRPMATMQVFPPQSGTISASPTYDAGNNQSTVTAATGTFYPEMVGLSLKFTTSGNSYTIKSYTSATVVLVKGDASGEAAQGWSVDPTVLGFRLPDNFGGLDTDITIEDNQTYYNTIKLTGEARMRALKQATSITSSRPRWAALRPEAPDAGGQRWRLLIWPEPDQLYTLQYRYNINLETTTNDNDYPVGGLPFAELYLESCLAIAEQRIDDTATLHTERFMRCLLTAIERDNAQFAQEHFGYNGDGSDWRSSRRGRFGRWGRYGYDDGVVVNYDG